MKYKIGQRVRVRLPYDSGTDTGLIIRMIGAEHYLVLLDSCQVNGWTDLQHLDNIDEKLKDPNKYSYSFANRNIKPIRTENLNLI